MVPSILIAVLLALSPTVAHSSPSQEVTLVLCAGDDWCVAGESVRKTCENPAFMAALGRRFRLIPETQAEGLNFETRRYPALFVFDNKQRLVARLENIPYDMKCEAIVEWVRSASKSADTAVALLEKKEFGRGFELLRQQNPGLFVRVGKKKEWTAVGFENEFKAMCAADPEDREGYFTAFTSGDGYGRINTATAKAGRSEGADFIKSLRARTTAHATVEQLQSIDMAEFAYLRKDGTAKERCRELLHTVIKTDNTTFWAWAAHGYLKEMGEEVPLPMDPAAQVPGGKGVVDYRLADEPDCELNGDELSRLGGDRNGSDDELRRAWTWHLVGRDAFDRVIRRGGLEFAQKFLSSREWMDGFLFSGPVPDPARAFSLLSTIVRNDAEGWYREPLGRTVATAIALNAGEKTSDERAVRLYLAYRYLAKVGRLHRFAYGQDVREWRFVIGKVQDAADILFAADFLNCPLAKYDNACWSVPYRGRNCFGESIHGKNYFRPWAGSDWPSLKIRQRVGAVCGGLSNFGATAANAHGIMATTAGQPGHCAYVLRREDTKRWGIAYSISRYTGPHYLFYKGGFTELDTLERAYADRAAQIKADLCVARAKLAEASGANDAEIERWYREATGACRSQVGAWIAYADWLERIHADEPRTRSFMRMVATALPEGRQLVWNIENACLERLAKMSDGREKAVAALEELYALLPQCKDVAIREECNWRNIMKKHGEIVGDQYAGRLLAAALKANCKNSDYFAAILGWGSEVLVAKSNRTEEFLAALKAVVPQVDGAGRIDFKAAIRSASKAGDLNTFRKFIELSNQFNPAEIKGKGYPTEAFGGELLSAQGMLCTSSTAKWDKPEFYGRVIDASGFAGKNTQFFHTTAETFPWAYVELPGPAEVKGVRLVNRFERKDLAARQVPFRVAVSENGKDWTDVAAVSELKSEYEIPIAEASQVRFVKIYRPEEANKKDYFHFQKILVYGKRLY